MGMAVMYNGELTDFRVRTFYRAWSPDKQDDMIAVIRKAVERYGIAKIVVKSPKPSHCSQNIQGLMSAIRQLAEQSGVRLHTCTITGLTERYMDAGGGNRQALVQAIVRKYPQHRQLAAIAAKKRVHRSLGQVKMFEAIACAEMA